MENGRITEIGTHDELIANPDGRYKKLYNLQDLSSARGVNNETDEASKKLDLEDMDISPEKAQVKSEDEKVEISKDEEKNLAKKANLFGREDYPYFLVGLVGALLTGVMVSPVCIPQSSLFLLFVLTFL